MTKQEKEAMPEGATHKDVGPSTVNWIRATDNTHDRWCCYESRWVTFEDGHNIIRKHWQLV